MHFISTHDSQDINCYRSIEMKTSQVIKHVMTECSGVNTQVKNVQKAHIKCNLFETHYHIKNFMAWITKGHNLDPSDNCLFRDATGNSL